VSDTTPAAMQRLLAAEFERHGWEYDLAVGREIVEEIERQGDVNGGELAKSISAEFLARTRASREEIADAIEHAIGGRTPKRDDHAMTTVVINDNRYQVNLGRGAQITDSKLNIGPGTQINVDVHASKDEVLGAVEAILRAGLAGSWNEDAARDLAALIDSRDDVNVDDVREITTEVVRAEAPRQSRARQLLYRIAAGGVGGALGTGISAGVGEIISQLPL